MSDGQTLMPTQDVARQFNVAVGTVTRWVQSGRLTAVQKLPGRTGAYLFDPEVVAEFAASRGVGV